MVGIGAISAPASKNAAFKTILKTSYIPLWNNTSLLTCSFTHSLTALKVINSKKESKAIKGT